MRITEAREGTPISCGVTQAAFADYAGSTGFLLCLESKFSNCRLTRYGLYADTS